MALSVPDGSYSLAATNQARAELQQLLATKQPSHPAEFAQNNRPGAEALLRELPTAGH